MLKQIFLRLLFSSCERAWFKYRNKNININSLQGDKEIIALIEKLKTKNKEILIDGSNCPDIIPIFSLYAAYLNKKVKIINVRRLRIKECDRLSATVQELSKLGFDLQERGRNID